MLIYWVELRLWTICTFVFLIWKYQYKSTEKIKTCKFPSEVLALDFKSAEGARKVDIKTKKKNTPLVKASILCEAKSKIRIRPTLRFAFKSKIHVQEP